MSHPRALLISCLAFLLLAAGPPVASAKRSLSVLKVVPKPAKGAVTKTIGAGGGTLRVKTPNRTAVTLTIPAGAFRDDTQITMTPLSGVRRVPFRRGVVAAVQLAPEGLTLLRPAKLTFRPRKRVPLNLQTPFSATGGGASFHVYPGKAGRAQLALPLFHFSVYGEGEATSSERARESNRAQSDAESRNERDLAAARSDESVALALLPFASHVADLTRRASTDDALALDALDQALSLAEELSLYGWSSEELPPHMGDQIPKSVDPLLRSRLEGLLRHINADFPDKILDNALAKATQHCAALHQPAQAERILAIEETRRRFGATDEVDLEPVKKCLTFELDIDSDFHTVGQRVPTDVHVQAKIPLHVTPDFSTWTGAGPIEYLNITEPYDSPCTAPATGSGTWNVLGMSVVPGKVDRRGSTVAPTQLKVLNLVSPQASEQYDLHCPGADTYHGESMWLVREWIAAHADETSDTFLYRVQNWSPGSGDLFGTKSYSRSYQDSGETWSETTTLELHHTPQG